MSDERDVIQAAIAEILGRRGGTAAELSPGVRLGAELGFTSLEFAELSAQLEDALGRDPYSDGAFPDTVDAITEYYRREPAPRAG
ncbi:acyl carrier protein [Nocardia sp. NPDC057353]|uniref:acyl carrier protein n=1 Tax=Nocardia sp. NPDC057353 TaxID=3346104 RepID=UPI003645742F